MWLVCSGLDHARRGYESFARECFEALRDDPGLRLTLIKGSGRRRPGEWVVPAARRDRAVARMAGRLTGAPPFRAEAASFGLGLLPALVRTRPDVIYVSEWDTAQVLARFRLPARRRPALLLSNGGFAAEGFDHLDRVQELTPAAREYVLARGADPSRHTVLPYGLAIPARLQRPSRAEQMALRGRLALPVGRPIVLSVAALNRSHKRLDYLIQELSQLPEPRPFLLLVGEPDAETPGVQRLAFSRLGVDGFDMRTVAAADVPELYRASDIFVLASLHETQGRALIEAAAHGAPCVAHDSPVMRFAVGDHGRYGDFAQPGELRALLRAQLDESPDVISRRTAAAHRHVFERFSWERLRPHYVGLLREVAREARTASSSTVIARG